MQCSLVLPVYLREGKAVGSEEGKGLGNGLRCVQRKETEHVALLRTS
jgi:hypothetical protein